MSMMKAGALALMIPLALSVPALAQQGEGRGLGPQMIFSEMDLDGDGVVTLEEMQAARGGHLATADADGDGLITRAELVAHAMSRAETRIDRLLQRADADGDGALSMAELAATRDSRQQAGLERMFRRVDADGDGRVTAAEFEAAMGRMVGRRGGHGDRGHGDCRGPGFRRG